ncbi:hypothetical protein HKX48_006862 [Thoreauomyces humboldtii]|nr:hypothetical protein HKX48_006862 [Thoreauomyces humboldtii]
MLASHVEPSHPVLDVLLVEQELNRLQKEVSKPELRFQQAKEDWVEKYSQTYSPDPEADGHDLGRGITFPDTDRPDSERLDIPALLKAHPKNVEAEFLFHKDLLMKLKFLWVEQKTKEGFLRRALDIPAREPSAAENAELDNRDAPEKALLKQKKASCAQKRADFKQLTVSTWSTHAELATQEATARQALQEFDVIDTESPQVPSGPLGPSTEATELEKLVAEQAAELAEQEEQAEHWKSTHERHSSKTATAESEMGRLRKRYGEADAASAEAVRISKSKDPQLEELGKWYREQTALLKHVQGIRAIRHPNAEQLEILWDLKGGVTCTMSLQFQKNSTTLSGWTLSGKFTEAPYHCPIADILDTANIACPTLESMLRYVTKHVPVRMRNLVDREDEMKILCAPPDPLATDHDDVVAASSVSYDPQSREVMVHADATARTFVLGLHEAYPWAGGADGITVLGVEPREGDEVAEWIERLRTSSVRKLGELVPLLQ